TSVGKHLKVVKAFDAEFAEQHLCCLESDAGYAAQIDHGHRQVSGQLLEVSRCSARDQVDDLGADSFSDAGDLLQLGSAATSGSLADWLVEIDDGAAGNPIGPYLEEILVLEFQQVRYFFKYASNVSIVHRGRFAVTAAAPFFALHIGKLNRLTLLVNHLRPKTSGVFGNP